MTENETKELRDIYYTAGRILQARIELEAMLVANRQRELLGQSPQYGEDAIRHLINEYGIHHNGLVNSLYGQ